MYPVLFHICVAFLIASVPVIFCFRPRLLLGTTILGTTILIVDKSSFCALLRIDVLETLVVDTQLKHFSMLDNVQRVVSNIEWVLERRPKLLSFKNSFSISRYLFLATEMTADEFNSDHNSI